MPYIVGERNQTTFLPSSIEDYIGPDDPVRAYDVFVEQLDFARLGIEIDPYQVGHPEFAPCAMVKLLVYGYSYGLRSSRKLERATYHNLSFIWLMGGLKPDHKTISRFRRNYRDALKNILKQCAHICLKLGLIEGNTLFVDGTKIRANASTKHTWTRDRCQKSLKEIDQRIDSILDECDAMDEKEQDQAPLVKMKKELAHQQHLKTEIKAILDDLTQEEKTAINTTDPECGRFRDGKQVRDGYNCQTVVDDKHGLIVQSDVVTDSSDVLQFSRQIDSAQETLDRPCRTACADAGYGSPVELQKTLDQGVDVIVPITRISDFRDHFTYDPKKNTYECPEHHHLVYTGIHSSHKSYIYRMADPIICQRCPRFGVCTTSAKGRRVERPFSEETRERLEQRYQQPEAQMIFRRRKIRVEHSFGHIKHNLGMRTFLLRGIAGAKAETALVATCFNLTRMVTLLGVKRFIQTLNLLPA
jgi:transposase